jgi:hypothetical protein
VLRAAIAGQIPLALGDAPRAGTGKSLFTEVIATITVGHNHGKMTEAESDAEWRKKITATLLAGHPINIIDNVTRTLESGHLSSVLSEPIWKDRALGTNSIVTVPSRAIWIATGNNIRVGGDIPRRTYRIRMDAKMAQPWTRSEFKHPDLLAWVESRRGDLVHALLTIARASMVREMPALKLPRMGGFDAWVSVVGRAVALDSVGVHFLGNVEELWETEDTDAAEWEAFLATWCETTFGDSAVTTRDVHEAVRSDSSGYRAHEELWSALPEQLARALEGHAFATKLGTALREHRETRYGAEGYRLVRVGKDSHTRAVSWQVLREEGRGEAQPF